MDLDTNGRDRYFYLALHDGKIIGTVFVHPNFQGQGVANVLEWDGSYDLERKGFGSAIAVCQPNKPPSVEGGSL